MNRDSMELGMVPVATRVRVVENRRGRTHERDDWLADEVPVALVFNGISHAVMLTTPADLEDFALGFALTECLIESRSELYGVEEVVVPDGIELRLDVSSACAWRLRERRRTLAGRTGCGLCGAENLAHVRRALPQAPHVAVPTLALMRAQHELVRYQELQRLTGASHAAAWCGLAGQVEFVREDVGRHNALDKLIGAMVRHDVKPDEGFICVTSRASFEMVQKTAAAGVGALAAVSAPTAMAVRSAEELGVALAGFVRGEDSVIYSHHERFQTQIAEHRDGP